MDAPRVSTRIEALVDRLQANGHRVWLVGGAVRDAVLGRTARDIDLLVDAPLPEVQRTLPEARRIGRREPILTLPGPRREPRVEIASLAERGRSLEADLATREFTVNALAFDLGKRTWCDPTGGLSDLRAGVLRALSPQETLRSDPVRVLRGLRLAGELSLVPEEATRRSMELEAWRLAAAPGERLRQELFRILRLERPGLVLHEARRCGALAALLPELHRAAGVLRPGATRDAYREALWLCDRLSPVPLLRLAALVRCSAVCDAKRYLARSGRFELQNLERHARALVPALVRRLRLSKREASGLERLVCHARLDARDDRAIRRMLERAGRDMLDELLELQRAELALFDPAGEPPAEWGRLETRVRGIARGGASAPLAVGGREVMQVLGIRGGPEVGRWLRRLHWRVVERPEENERERLLAWLERASASGEA